MTSAARCLPFALAAALLPAQGDPNGLWQKVEKGEPLIELSWRRDEKGSFEYSVAASQDAAWKPWFGTELLDVIGSTGAVGFLAPLVNPSDLVGLTNAARHLRRIGVALSTGDLAAFVRTPMPAALGRTALFDRMLAIDVLRTRTDSEAKVVLTQLGSDQSLPKELRERAAGVVQRAKLDPAAWALPAAPDVVVVMRPARMPSASYVVELGRFSGYASSVAVLTMLKAPSQADLLMGETESDALSHFAFEVARRVGNHRFDEVGFALCLPREGSEPDLALSFAGAFDVGALVGAGDAAAPLQCERDGDAAKLAIADGSLVGRVAADRLDLHSKSLALAPRPGLAKELLANVDAVLLAHVPEGSQLCAMAEQIGLSGIQRADLAVTLRAADVLLEMRLGARDAEAAKTLATAIRAKLKELGWVGAAAMLALTLDESLLRVDPKDSTVNVSLPLPRAAIPSLDAAKAHVLKRMRER